MKKWQNSCYFRVGFPGNSRRKIPGNGNENLREIPGNSRPGISPKKIEGKEGRKQVRRGIFDERAGCV